jgi:ABC-type lipoprotein release transport system permease subunit
MLRIAWRNLLRNKTRTGIALSSVAISYWLLLFGIGANDYGYEKLLEQAGKTVGGGVLVHGEGWWDDPVTARFIQNPAPILEASKKLPGVQRVATRVLLPGLLSSSRASAGVEVRGIDWQVEESFTETKRFLVKGDYLDVPHKRPLVLGAGLAKKLGIQVGDRVVLTTTDPSGDMTRALFRLTGIVQSGSQAIDDTVAVTTVKAAQKAVGYDEALTQVGLLLGKSVEPEGVKAALVREIGETPQLETLTWREAMPQLIKLIEMDKQQGWIVMVLIMVVVAFGVTNTMLMSVLERVRELGLQAALGMTPTGIARLIVAETLVLSLVSLAIGGTMGMIGHFYLAEIGIPLGAMGENLEMGGVVIDDYRLGSAIDPPRWIGGTLMVFGLMFISALYPALRAARLDPAKAMRTYE